MRPIKILSILISLSFGHFLMAAYGPNDPYYQMVRGFVGSDSDESHDPEVILLGETHLGKEFRDADTAAYERYKNFEEPLFPKRDAEIIKMAAAYGRDRPIVVLYEGMSFHTEGFDESDRTLMETHLLPNLETILSDQKIKVRGWDNVYLGKFVINPLMERADKKSMAAIDQALIGGMRNYSLLQSIERCRKLYKHPLIFVVSGAEHAINNELVSELFERKIKYRALLSILSYAIMMNPRQMHMNLARPPVDAAYNKDYLQNEVWPLVMADRLDEKTIFGADQIDAQESYSDAKAYLEKHEVVEQNP